MKKFCLFLASFYLLFSFFQVSASNIYQYIEQQTIIKGVTISYIDRITDKGFQKIHIAQADLNHQGFDIRLLLSGDGSGYRDNMLKICDDNGAVMGINGDFFQPSLSSRLTSPIGMEVENGQLISTPEEKMASMGISEDRIASMDYFGYSGRVIAPNGSSFPIIHKNKFYDQGGLVLYDRNWGMQSPGYPLTTFEMVVENDIVTSMSGHSQPVDIPANGYVLASTGDHIQFLSENFSIGQRVSLEISVMPLIENMSTAVSGGSLLIKNGETVPLTHIISGTHPRTAIGVDKTGKIVTMVTVDGRYEGSLGMSMSELSQLMLELGCDTALNLDGGGSTTFIARDFLAPEPELKNRPSDGPMRAVSNGVGIVPKTGEMTSLAILRTPIYANQDNPITVVGLDENNNTIMLEQSDVVVMFDHGTITESGMIHPEKEGLVPVYVRYGEIERFVDMLVLPNADSTSLINQSDNKHQEVSTIAVFGKESKTTLLESFFVNRSLYEMEKNSIKSFRLDGGQSELEQFEGVAVLQFNPEDVGAWAIWGQQLNEIEGNLIVLAKTAPSGSLYSQMLMRLLKNKVVERGYKAYYISSGSLNQQEIIDGVRVITLAGSQGVTTQQPQTFQNVFYLSFNIDQETQELNHKIVPFQNYN